MFNRLLDRRRPSLRGLFVIGPDSTTSVTSTPHQLQPRTSPSTRAYAMAHVAKPDSEWATTLKAFVDSGDDQMVHGTHPKTGKWHTQYSKIKDCPKQTKDAPSAKGKITSFLPASNVVSASGAENPYHRSYKRCNCGWHDGTNTLLKLHLPPPPAASQQQSTASTNDQPKIRLSFNIPQKPDPRKNIADVRSQSGEKIKPYYTGKEKGKNAVYPLEVFAYVSGKCPKCGSPPASDHRLNESVKIIHTTNLPRFVQGIKRLAMLEVQMESGM